MVVVVRPAIALLAVVLLAACAAPPPAPVTDRSVHPRQSESAERAERPEAYRVRTGDTLYSIAFRYGLDWRVVADWNDIDAPYVIHPGEVVRLREPRRRPDDTRTARRETPSRPVSRPVEQTEPTPSPAERADPRQITPPVKEPEPESTPPPESSPAQTDPALAETDGANRAPAPDATERAVAGIRWRWPASGRMVRAFDGSATRKGIGIAGSRGDPVRAAAPGTVVYSGSGLLGYGELIIIKHSDSLLSAYGHNRSRRVEEGDRVQAGEQIAELGVNERNDPMLHFEIRLNGQPENPLKYLPAR